MHIESQTPSTVLSMGLPRHELRFLILLTVFVACMAFINIVSAKLWSFAGLTISGGIMAYWLTFPITDAVGEVFGHKRAYFVVWMGLLANLLILLLSQIAIHLPPAAVYGDQDALARVLGAVPVIVLASVLAYVLAQLHDVWAFAFWKRVTAGKHLWLRNNLSTMTSQFIDSLVFNSVAFYLLATEPVSIAALIPMTLGYWLFKVGIAVVDTPVVYFLVWWLRPETSAIES